VGVSRTSLCENFELLGIFVRDTRDLMRLLRALRQARTDDCAPETLLLVTDRRTLKTLLERGVASPFGADALTRRVDSRARFRYTEVSPPA
jgi:hypothetical protein